MLIPLIIALGSGAAGAVVAFVALMRWAARRQIRYHVIGSGREG